MTAVVNDKVVDKCRKILLKAIKLNINIHLSFVALLLGKKRIHIKLKEIKGYFSQLL